MGYMKSLATQIVRYEEGELPEEEIIELFQNLIDSGMLTMLQGHYGRAAKAYVDRGLVRFP